MLNANRNPIFRASKTSGNFCTLIENIISIKNGFKAIEGLERVI